MMGRQRTKAIAPSWPREPPPPQPLPAQSWLLWRQDLSSYYRSLDQTEAACLGLAIAGASFGAICECAAESGTVENPALLAAQFLDTWLSGGLVTALTPA